MPVIEYEELYENYKLTIYQDPDSESPFEWSDFSLVAFHSRYNLSEGLGKQFKTPESFDEWTEDHPVVLLPVYMLDHSGLRFKTTPFTMGQAGWYAVFDSGQLGYIFITREQLKKQRGWLRLTEKRRTLLRDQMIATIRSLDQYYRGDVYFYTITNEFGDIVDSCGGIYGLDHTLEFADFKNVVNRDRAERAEFDIPFPITGV